MHFVGNLLMVFDSESPFLWAIASYCVGNWFAFLGDLLACCGQLVAMLYAWCLIIFFWLCFVTLEKGEMLAKIYFWCVGVFFEFYVLQVLRPCV